MSVMIANEAEVHGNPCVYWAYKFIINRKPEYLIIPVIITGDFVLPWTLAFQF